MEDAPQSESQSQSHDIELGFKSLTLCCPKKDQKMHQNSCIMASNLMSPPPSPAFSHIGDYIGMESCLDMNSCEDVHVMSVTKATSYDHVLIKRESSRKKKKKTTTTREFPPPISLLARTENLSSHMAFVLKRYYTNDGRLILREEPVRRHEYFRAHRSNGHLTLQLVPLEDDDDYESEHEHAQEFEAEAEANVEEDEEMKIEEGFVTQIPKSCINNNEGIDIGCGGGGGGGEMCLNYSNVIISSSCYLGVPPVPAIKPVHT